MAFLEPLASKLLAVKKAATQILCETKSANFRASKDFEKKYNCLDFEVKSKLKLPNKTQVTIEI